MVAAVQRRAFVQALSIADTAVQETERLDQVIRSIRDEFAAKEQPPGQEEVRRIADLVLGDARKRMQDVADRLNEELRGIFPSAAFFPDCEKFADERRDWHRWQVIEVAKTLGYYANLRDYAAWCRLVFKTDRQAEVLLSLHSVGRDFRGIIAASLSFFRREEIEPGWRQATDLTPVLGEVFQMNYRDDEQSVRERFSAWLEAGLVQALQMWRRSL